MKKYTEEYWGYLIKISNTSSFEEQLKIFRYFAHLEALIKIECLIQQFVNDFPKKQQNNINLDINKYHLQCESFITPFLFQSPLFPCKDFSERSKFNEMFKNWSANEYCDICLKQLKEAFFIS